MVGIREWVLKIKLEDTRVDSRGRFFIDEEKSLLPKDFWANLMKVRVWLSRAGASFTVRGVAFAGRGPRRAGYA
jgi:hypothetical protein